jgi:hypothetical protein
MSSALPASPSDRPTGAPGASLFAAGREARFLDLDFQTPDRPRLVTAVLSVVAAANELPAPDDSPLWQLSLASRLKRLLHVVRDTEAITVLPLRLRCPHPECQQDLEIELAFDDLDALHTEAADRELLRFPGADSRPIAFRRPTGDDLRRWRSSISMTSPDPESLFHDLLVPEPAQPGPIKLPSAELCAAAFSEFDALVAFQIATTCPHCTRESTLPVDLEAIGLGRLKTVQQRLYRENHRLAQAYGWSEAEILSVPRGRRQRYLAQLEALT